MNHQDTPPARDGGRAFRIHLIGGVVFALVAGLQLGRVFSTPVDLFIHQTFVVEAVKTLVGIGALYYGFSLVLLCHCPLPGKWAVAYAVMSLALLVVALYPIAPFGMAGMMRRTAYPERHADLGAVLAWVRIAQWTAGATFAVVQAAFLRFAWRRREISG